jgi:hypothetical protein
MECWMIDDGRVVNGIKFLYEIFYFLILTFELILI